MRPVESEHPRRRFLRTGALALAGTCVSAGRSLLQAQAPDPVLLPSFVADVDGNGLLDPVDPQLVQNALAARRGFDLTPHAAYDVRTDVFGRGVVDRFAVESVRRTVQAQSDGLVRPERRPITVAWHYGWYGAEVRPPGLQTVRFKGGDYRSQDPEIETLFNDQKNEFGITVDALSWIPPRFNRDLLNNYRGGLLNAPNLRTRQLALLYESTIALSLTGDRIDFSEPSVPALLRDDFAHMGRFLAEARDAAGARIFTLDGRPAVFIFGSHTWGLLPVEGVQFSIFERAMDAAREAFRGEYGTPPFVVGEEMHLAAGGPLPQDRLRRMRSFDAIYTYHHAPLKTLRVAAGLGDRLFASPRYIDHQAAILRHNFRLTAGVRNRYTGHPVLVIPNLAPGFAKPGYPLLMMGRGEYADFMKTVRDAHVGLLAEGPWQGRLGAELFPAPIYAVGSWNEEFEGHAVFPASFNESLPEVVQEGFDLVMAIKETFGWNHYAERDVLP